MFSVMSRNVLIGEYGTPQMYKQKMFQFKVWAIGLHLDIGK